MFLGIPVATPTRTKEVIDKGGIPGQTDPTMPKPSGSQSRLRQSSQSRTQSRTPTRPGSARAAAAAKPAPSPHLIERLTATQILVAFAVLVAVVGAAILFFSDARTQYLGREARVLMKKKLWAKALASWQPLLDRFPQSPVINMRMGECLLELGKPQEALARLDDAVSNLGEIRGDNTSVVAGLYALRGWALLELGRTQEAIEDLRKELTETPDDPRANYLLGDFLAKQGDFVHAAAFFQRIANRPEYASKIAEFKKKMAEQLLKIPDEELTDVPEQVGRDQVTSVPISPLERKQPKP